MQGLPGTRSNLSRLAAEVFSLPVSCQALEANHEHGETEEAPIDAEEVLPANE